MGFAVLLLPLLLLLLLLMAPSFGLCTGTICMLIHVWCPRVLAPRASAHKFD